MVARAVGNFGARSIGVIQTMDDTGKDLGAGVKMACEKLDLPCEIFQIRADAWDADRAAEGIKARQPDFVIVAAAQAAAPRIIGSLAAGHVRIPVFTTYLNTVVTQAQQILPVTEGMFPVYASGWLNYEEERGKNLEAASEWLGDYAMNTYAHCGWIGAHFLCEGLRRLKRTCGDLGELPGSDGGATHHESLWRHDRLCQRPADGNPGDEYVEAGWKSTDRLERGGRPSFHR